MTNKQGLPKPGERVVIKPEAQAAVGGVEGVVVGFRDEPPASGVVVAIDKKVCDNAVVAPEDIERVEA